MKPIFETYEFTAYPFLIRFDYGRVLDSQHEQHVEMEKYFEDFNAVYHLDQTKFVWHKFLGSSYFWFKDKHDAIAFKLLWKTR